MNARGVLLILKEEIVWVILDGIAGELLSLIRVAFNGVWK